MKIVACMLARNEDWVIGLSLRAALMWCDAVVLLLHNCMDDTRSEVGGVIAESPNRVSVLRDESSDWEEMRLRQSMLQMARDLKATHIALIDADEVLTGNLLPTIREYVEKTPAGTVLQLPWLQLAESDKHRPARIPFGQRLKVMTSGMWASQNVSVAFPDDPEYHWRARDVNTVTSGGDGRSYDHHHRHPMGKDFRPWFWTPDDWKESPRSGGLMHLQFLSRRRLIAKQFLYQLTERKRWGFDANTIKAKYVPTVTEADAAKLSAVPESWWAPYQHLLQYLHIDREPWQERECLRLVAENPGIEKGLEDFGLLENVERATQ